MHCNQIWHTMKKSKTGDTTTRFFRDFRKFWFILINFDLLGFVLARKPTFLTSRKNQSENKSEKYQLFLTWNQWFFNWNQSFLPEVSDFSEKLFWLSKKLIFQTFFCQFNGGIFTNAIPISKFLFILQIRVSYHWLKTRWLFVSEEMDGILRRELQI